MKRRGILGSVYLRVKVARELAAMDGMGEMKEFSKLFLVLYVIVPREVLKLTMLDQLEKVNTLFDVYILCICVDAVYEVIVLRYCSVCEFGEYIELLKLPIIVALHPALYNEESKGTIFVVT